MGRRKANGKKIEIPSSCGLCDKPDNNNMVCCDSCDVWHHFKCVGVKKKDLGDEWYCPACKSKLAEVRKSQMNNDKRPQSPTSGQNSSASKAIGPSSDKRLSSPARKERNDKRHQSPPKGHLSHESPSSHRTRTNSQMSTHTRSQIQSQDVEEPSEVPSPRASSYLSSLYQRSETYDSDRKQRLMSIEMQRIEEERRLNLQRDREYLDKKYQVLSKNRSDTVGSMRQLITGTWINYHKETPFRPAASLHHSQLPSESKSVKSFNRRLHEIQFDNTSPRKVQPKIPEVYQTKKCVDCEMEGDERTFVTCCLCNEQGHHECLETYDVDKDVLWICSKCRLTIPTTEKPQDKAERRTTQDIPVQKTKVESRDDERQHCEICHKVENGPLKQCDICYQYRHFQCMELARQDDRIIWMCYKCIGIENKRKTDKNRIPVPPVIKEKSEQPVPPVIKENSEQPVPPVIKEKSEQPVPPVITEEPVPPVIAEQPIKTKGETNVQGSNVPGGATGFGDMQNLYGFTANSTNRSCLTGLQIASRHVISKDLPRFNGNPEDWPLFISRYNNSTESCGYSNAENLDRLQRCLQGVAFTAVKSRLNIPEAVPDIIETLRLLYGRPELIIDALLKKIRQQEPPKTDKLNTLVDFALSVKNLSATMEQTDLSEHSSNPSLIKELVEKLPTNIKIEWARYKVALGQKKITLIILGDWLYRLAEVISTVTEPTLQSDKPKDKAESSDKHKSNDKYKPSRTNVHQNYQTEGKSSSEVNSAVNVKKSEDSCSICKKNCRNVEECSSFKSFDPEQRWKAMVESKLCRKCLKRHSGVCKSTKTCGENGCSCKHHRLLHDPVKHSAFTKDKSVPTSQSTVAHSSHNVHINSIPHVIYRIVPVTLYNRDKFVKVLAYIDEGSDLTLMERRVAEELNLFGVHERLCLLWTAKVHRFEEKSTIVNLEISGQKEFTRKFELLGVRTVEDLGLPEQTIDIETLSQKYPYIAEIPLIEYSGTPRILIGLANASLCTQLNKLEGNEYEPIVSQSRIGWSIHGPTRKPNDVSKQNMCQVLVCQKHKNEEILHRLVKEHFTVENFGVQVNNNLNVCSKEDERALKMLQSLTKRTENGFETGLLFKNDYIELPDSYYMAKRRLICLEKQKPSKVQAIDDRIKEFISKGYVSKLDQSETFDKNQRIWYLPIFTVVYPKKPNKIRLVFDAAAEVDGISLNKVLLKGPDQVSSLVDILRRFREKCIAINGDIKEMFHRIGVRKEDRQLQRFLWRNGDESKEPEVYVLNVMTFGAKCSPSSAQFVKNKNAKEFEEKYPQAVTSIVDNHYVDDMMDGGHTEEETIQLVKQVQEIHRHGNFEIRNFISNSRKVMEAIGSTCENESKNLDVDTSLGTERVLGMYWNTELDCFNFSLKYTKIHQDVAEGNRYPTKRELLKTLMSIFDPLGLLSQYLVHLKILLQEVWRSDMKWDDQLTTEDTKAAWNEWFSLLSRVESIRIPRLYSPKISPGIPTSIELHTFVDASDAAFSAVVYLRIEDEQGVDCALVGSKVRVAPLKYMSIPRKELQAGVLGTRLTTSIVNGQRLKIDRKIYWSDSSTLLSWIKSDHRKYHQFVAHRIGEILESTELDEWRWVPSKENVADDATKSSNVPNLDISGRWYQGPDFLRRPESEWPKQREIELNTSEEMKVHCLHSKFMMSELIQPERFSNWNRMVRSLAYVIRFVQILKAKTKILGPLTQEELEKSQNLIFRQAQFENYPEEMVILERNKTLSEAKRKPIPKTSSLINFLPYLDESNVLRVQGRMGSNIELQDDVKRPIILPRCNRITRLLVLYYHQLFHHRNYETVTNEMRQKFYIPRMRVLLRSVRINDCQQCKVRKTKPVNPQMGNLPPARLALTMRPFHCTGIDYFGPISVACGRTQRKRWGVLFTCLTIRAVHIEIAHSLNTSSTIMCIRNFMNRRGRPNEMYSDSGTNLKGADNELKRLVDVDKLATTFTTCYTKWSFNPPTAASMGGSWERLVRSIKTCLYDIMPTRTPTDDVFMSLLIEAENIVNSRPLTFIPLDYEEDEAITPNHFLIGSSNGIKAPFDVDLDGPYLKSSWKEIQRLTDLFWKRFVKEYVPTLHERTKWHYSVDPIKPGDIVVIYDDDNPRNTYPKAKVLDTIMGSNNQVRKVLVQKGDARKTIFWRPAYRLARLDVYKQPTDGSLAANTGSSKTGGSVTTGRLDSQIKDDNQNSASGLSYSTVNNQPESDHCCIDLTRE